MDLGLQNFLVNYFLGLKILNFANNKLLIWTIWYYFNNVFPLIFNKFIDHLNFSNYYKIYLKNIYSSILKGNLNH